VRRKLQKPVSRSNPRFQRFREEYLKTGNAYRAALAAGYSPKMAKGRS